MSRLCHTTVREIELDPVKYAKSFSMQNSCVVVLKFARTVIASPDGRVFGKMGHSERVAPGLYKNVPGNYDIKIFLRKYEFNR